MGTEGATPNSSAGLVPVRPGAAGAIIQAMHGKGGMGVFDSLLIAQKSRAAFHS